jgi:hypothetical protein
MIRLPRKEKDSNGAGDSMFKGRLIVIKRDPVAKERRGIIWGILLLFNYRIRGGEDTKLLTHH